MALSDIRAFSSHGAFDLVAVADVDLSRAEPVKKLFPNVRVYQDWRELLRKEADNLDSVDVSTPDHMHAPIAMAAMSLRQARLRAEAAGDDGPRDPYAGGRGTRNAWCRDRHRNLVASDGWPTELMIRAASSARCARCTPSATRRGATVPIPSGSDPIPESLDWDMWLGRR